MSNESSAKYYMVFSKGVVNADANDAGEKPKLNDKNPIYRIRNSLKQKETDKETEKNIIYPSSYLPDLFFKNTVSHPYLIFYNANKKFDEIEKGSTFPNKKPNDKTIIEQLDEYFGVKVLSFAQLKVDPTQVSDTWNERFPSSKSNLFSPIQEGFKVKEVSDLQSLHLLAFSLNISLYLIFPIGDKYLYNMKLGPDNSDNDVHFKVSFIVDKSKITFDNDITDSSVYKQDKWLTFELIKMGKESTSPLDLVPFGSGGDEKQNILLLEMEKRDPIPIIKIPRLSIGNDLKKITLQIEKSPKNRPNISFINKKNSSIITIKASISNDEYIPNKIKSIATKLLTSSNTKNANIENTNKSKIVTIIAQTNESAFLVTETKLKGKDKDSFGFQFGKPFTQLDIKNSIISYSDRLKKPYKYSYLIGKDKKTTHPLVNLICLYNIAHIMLYSTSIIDALVHRDPKDRVRRIRVVPIEKDDEVFLSFMKAQHFFNDDSRGRQVQEEYKENWRKLTKTYPTFISAGQDHEHDKNYDMTIIDNKIDSMIFQQFYHHVSRMGMAFFDDVMKIMNSSKQAIDQLMASDIGLNPIFCPVIYKEYIELARSNCIYFYSCQLYDNPLNVLLLQNVQSVEEVLKRTTTEFFNTIDVIRNVDKGIFPVKVQTLLKKIEDKKDQRIPDPSFSFIKSHDITEDIEGELEVKTKIPKYQYSFHGIEDGKVINTTKFTLFSQFKLSYAYVSLDNVFTVAQIDEENFSYGYCKTIDTEITFSEPHQGIFQSAIYMENDKCLLISHLQKNKNAYDGKIHFTGYDEQGQINEFVYEPIDFKSTPVPENLAKSLVILSKTYFAIEIKKEDKKTQEICVFRYNSKKRIIEICNSKEFWRYRKNDLAKKYLDEATNSKCFIGSRYSSKENDSTLCIYKYDDQIGIFTPIGTNDGIDTTLNFVLDENEYNYINDETRLLDIRIKDQNRVIRIPSMLNCLPIEEKDSFSLFDINCSLCELFPSPIVINNRMVTCSNDQLSFYYCDYKVYRLLPLQISGFFTNTLQRMSLFTTEMLLNQYNFKKIKVAMIVDTCGIGVRFSNLLFGTKFDENQIIDDEIWSGFSYSENVAYIVLLFHVKNVDAAFNAVQTRKAKDGHKFSPSIFMCQNDGVKNYIKFGFEPKIIITPANSNAGNIKQHISFVNSTEFEDNIADVFDKIKNEEDEHVFNNTDKAINFAKEIITQYLCFNTFTNYPLKTVQKYSDIFNGNFKEDGDFHFQLFE